MKRIHLDTDPGGDPDDLCALTMLLGWPDVEITGITTTADADGQRAGYVQHILALLGRDEIPVAAGAGGSITTGLAATPFVDDKRFWPDPISPVRSAPGAFLELITRSIDAGATIVGIGPGTNIALLELVRPGSLREVPVTLMGGWVSPPEHGLPAWGPEMDWNIQWDIRASEIIATSDADLTLVTLPVTLKAHLCESDMAHVRASGPVGEIIARQSMARADDAAMRALGHDHSGLPDDLLNFHFDPLACAVALGWGGATVQKMTLLPRIENDVLQFVVAREGRTFHVCSDVDGPAFSAIWLRSIQNAQTSSHTSARHRDLHLSSQ